MANPFYMSEESLLNQIMAKNKEEELANFNIADFITRLFSGLNKREQEVLMSRFGLGGFRKETLEAIGQKHELTRERIRQIETTSIAKLKKIGSLDQSLSHIGQALAQIVAEHAGGIDKDYLKEIVFALSNNKQSLDKEAHDRYVEFLVAKLLDDHFEDVKKSSYFSNFVKLKALDTAHMEKVAEELLAKVKDLKKLLDTKEAISLAKNLDTYKEHAEKFVLPNELDLSSALEGIITDYNPEVYEHRGLYGILRAVSELEQNKFKQWGIANWRDIKPKTINDKIYLVLKNNGKPMYYGDIAKKISDMGFDRKDVNVATTHNELILDDKYVLVGRGLYGLKEWGYKSGTVADIIANVLEKDGELSKEDIIKKVMEQRMVKQTTVNLALMDKKRFKKLDNGKYGLVK